MDVTGDFEIIRSALMMGDLNDAVWKIDSVIKKSENLHIFTGKSVYADYVKVMKTLKDVLKGDKTVREMRNMMTSDQFYSLYPGNETEKFVDTFLFNLEFCLDRYNVKYPDYDEKRCDDK